MKLICLASVGGAPVSRLLEGVRRPLLWNTARHSSVIAHLLTNSRLSAAEFVFGDGASDAGVGWRGRVGGGGWWKCTSVHRDHLHSSNLLSALGGISDKPARDLDMVLDQRNSFICRSPSSGSYRSPPFLALRITSGNAYSCYSWANYRANNSHKRARQHAKFNRTQSKLQIHYTIILFSIVISVKPTYWNPLQITRIARWDFFLKLNQ